MSLILFNATVSLKTFVNLRIVFHAFNLFLLFFLRRGFQFQFYDMCFFSYLRTYMASHKNVSKPWFSSQRLTVIWEQIQVLSSGLWFVFSSHNILMQLWSNNERNELKICKQDFNWLIKNWLKFGANWSIFEEIIIFRGKNHACEDWRVIFHFENMFTASSIDSARNFSKKIYLWTALLNEPIICKTP